MNIGHLIRRHRTRDVALLMRIGFWPIGGAVTPPTYTPALKLNDARNSQYLALLAA